MTLDRTTTDNLLTVLAAAYRAIPSVENGCTMAQASARAGLLACYGVLAEMYAEAGYDTKDLPKLRRK